MKDIKLYISGATVLFILYLVAQYNRPKAVDWSENYRNSEKSPYGTYILYNRIRDIFPKSIVTAYREPVYNVLSDHNVKTGTYVIICNNARINEYDYDKLNYFARDGNDVFVAASYFGGEFKKRLKIRVQSEVRTDAGAKLVSPSLDSTHLYTSQKNLANNYFGDFDPKQATILGKNNFGHINFISYKIGRGTIYLNANPLLFTNYSLLKDQGTLYSEKALSYLKDSKSLIWDEYYTQGRDVDNNMMRVFLTHTALRWAFYVSFFSLMIFVLYDMKRRQRIIPVINPLANSTLEFVNVVGQVYYEQRDNSNIAQKKILYLLEYLREIHHVKTTKLDEEFTANIIGKFGLKKQFAIDVTNFIRSIGAKSKVSDAELIQLNKLIEQLYIQAK